MDGKYCPSLEAGSISSIMLVKRNLPAGLTAEEAAESKVLKALTCAAVHTEPSMLSCGPNQTRRRLRGCALALTAAAMSSCRPLMRSAEIILLCTQVPFICAHQHWCCQGLPMHVLLRTSALACLPSTSLPASLCRALL